MTITARRSIVAGGRLTYDFFDVVTSMTTVGVFFPLDDFPFVRFDLSVLMTILPPTAVNARTS